MKFLRNCTLILLVVLAPLSPQKVNAAATILPQGETCWQATTGINGMVGLLGSITGGSGGSSGTYGGVALTGGSGSGATANITVSGGSVTAIAILNPGTQYVVGDVLSAASVNIGNVTGFSVPISSISINSSLAGGTVAFYIPNTSTFKQTWFNADQSSNHQNTNPVQLDANGCAIVYGAGSYREVVQDSLGNTIYDQLTTDTSATNSIFWAGTASGSPNAITVVDPGFNGTDGSIVQFVPLFTNTSAATITLSGIGPYQIVKDTSSGAVPLTGGEIVANSPSNVVQVVFNASQNNFHILNLVQPSASITPTPIPQGYLTNLSAASGGPILGAADVVGATTIYYSPLVGNQIPIWNGSGFSILSFPELSIGLTASAQASSTIYDACVFNNAGSATGVIGPAWANSSAGAGSRGSGAGTAQLIRENGIWVNQFQINANNGSTTFTIPALKCTYVGSIVIDSSAGQVSSYRTWGQNRKFGVWNAYNRQNITLQAGDSASQWNYTTNTIRQSDGSPGNTIQLFSGLPEEQFQISFLQKVVSTSLSGSTVSQISWDRGIGFNSTTAYTGTTVSSAGYDSTGGGSLVGFNLTASDSAQYAAPPSIGINNVNSLERTTSAVGSSAAVNYQGGQDDMLLSASWHG